MTTAAFDGRRLRSYSCNCNHMFETFAALSTISCIVIFVVLYRIDRVGRLEDAARDAAAQADRARAPKP